MPSSHPGIAFHKYHGCGNDFILIDTTYQPHAREANFHQLAPQWCHRQFGIGADQLLINAASPHDPSLLQLRIFNSDGSPAGMCGNGLRCIAKYAADKLLVRADTVHIAIGPRTYLVAITRDQQGSFVQAHVAMGQPEFDPARIPVSVPVGVPLKEPAHGTTWSKFPQALTRDVTPVLNVPLLQLCPEIVALHPASSQWRVTCLSMGNPHAVIFLDEDLQESTVRSAGPLLESASCFPSRCNVHFAQVCDPRTIMLLTWERGSGPTLACGSGACAVAVAGVLMGNISREVSIRQRGGTVQVDVDPVTAMVTLSGPATHVYSGHVDLENVGSI